MPRYEVIQSTFPEELPPGSVVLDKSETAWQSYKGGDNKTYWSPAIASRSIYTDQGRPWAYLVIEEAPLQVLYKAGEN